jgi:hypothetical protein
MCVYIYVFVYVCTQVRMYVCTNILITYENKESIKIPAKIAGY